jgi:aminopeptidase N
LKSGRSFFVKYCSRSFSLEQGQWLDGGPDPYQFALPGDRPHYAPDRPADVQHVDLHLALDLDAGRVSGSVATTFRALFDDLRQVRLSAAELEIERVALAGGPALGATQDGRHLVITLDRAYQHEETFTIEITYSARPRTGMHFVQPGPDDPTRPVQVWTQGQPETNHFWFPCHDSPNDRATTSLAVTVPAPYFALSNGRLERVEETPGKKTYFWRHDIPHPAYLVTLVVGDFARIEDTWDGLPVQYYVRRDREQDARLMMGKTPDMLAFYSERFGARYPYEKYAQVVCELYTGAMEHTSATTHSFSLLPDPRGALDALSPKLVVAHELVHQWFGDLLTCRDWSHLWLNESFATYFEAAYVQYDDGEDAFRYELRENLRGYLAQSYRRPIVHNVYNSDGSELFDAHAYQKGSLVLHLLRFVLGEQGFWRAIQHYLRSNRGREVITADLERAIEETTGRSMGQFFEQWVYRAGHPEFEVSFTWDEEHKLASVAVKQAQKIDEHFPCFVTPVDIALTMPGADDQPANGSGAAETQTFRVQIEQAEQRFYFPLPRKPVMVRFDPGGWILKTLKFERPAEMLRYQLEHDPDVLGRIEAAEALGKLGDDKSVEALAAALRRDPFWGVRAEVAETLGKLRTTRALEALLSGLEETRDHRARRAIVSALGQFRAPEQAELAGRAAAALGDLLAKGDPSYFVEGATANALGRTRASGAFEQLTAALDRPSWNEIIRSNVLRGLAALGEPRVAGVLAEWVDRSKPIQARAAAAEALGTLGSDHRLDSGEARGQIVSALLSALDDPWPPVRRAAARALGALGEQSALGALERLEAAELDGNLVRAARLAAQDIRSGKSSSDELKQLHTDLDEVKSENRKLRERLAALEARLEKQP